MKKISLILCLTFMLFSCSSDDDFSKLDLIGGWTLIAEDIGQGRTLTGFEEVTDDCEKTNSYFFTESTLVVEEYLQNFSECSHNATFSGEYDLKDDELISSVFRGQRVFISFLGDDRIKLFFVTNTQGYFSAKIYKRVDLN